MLGKTIRRFKHIRPDRGAFHELTIGVVVDANDPQQMGRLRVMCPTLGDNADSPIRDIPWAKYISPLGGFVTTGSRGPDDNSPTDGPVAYGMWSIPKVGAQVLVACVDANTEHRIWLGCLYGDHLPHTMPHGRYTYQEAEKPNGPLSSTEEPIQPLYDNLTEAFGDRSTNFEWRSRGADNQCSYVDGSVMDRVISFLQDDQDVPYTEEDGNKGTSTQGYARSRIAPNLTSEETGKNYDSQIYSWTTPGFHGLSMDDKPDNCRMRFRTSSGHQILMDDTNERIYIATAEGKCWIEMDQNGNVDIHTDKRLSVHAKQDINFTTEEAFRVTAKQIHMRTTEEMRLHADTDFSLRANGNTRIQTIGDSYIETDGMMTIDTDGEMHTHSVGNMFVNTDGDMHTRSDGSMYLENTGGNMHAKSAGTMNLDSSGQMNHLAGGNIVQTGAQIHMNGPTAASATAATDATQQDTIIETAQKFAYTTNRIPLHEPWGRIMVDPAQQDKDDAANSAASILAITNESGILEIPYTDANVGKTELGETTERGPFWHR